MRTKLKRYQKKGVRKIEHFKGRALLADDMGLGKTIQTLAWFKQHPEIKLMIVICPASLKWVWESQAIEHIGIRCDILQGRTPPKNKRRIGKHSRIIILNYEILQYWFDYLITLNPDALVIDECHRIKSRKTIARKKVKKLSKDIKYVIAISGTPLLNRPAELWTTLNLVRPEEYNSFYAFAWRYCKPVKMPWGWEYKGGSNLRELHRKLKTTMMIRRLKKEVLDELPNKNRQIIPLELSNKKEYQNAVDNFMQWLTKKSPTKAKKAQKAEKLVKIGYLKRLAAELKIKAVIKWIDEFLEGSDEKLVLFAYHKTIIEILHKKYKDISVTVTGSTSSKKRKLAVKGFNQNKKIRIFIGNIHAAGVGISLKAAHLAFAELDFVPGNHTQAEDRIHGIGRGVVGIGSMFYYLVAKNTIEEKLCQLIQDKQKMVAEILDGSAIDNNLNIWDELEKELARNHKNEKIKNKKRKKKKTV